MTSAPSSTPDSARPRRREDAPFAWGIALGVVPALLLAVPLTLTGARLYQSGIGFAGLGGVVFGAFGLVVGGVATVWRRSRSFGLGMLTGSLADVVIGGCVNMLPALWV